MVPIKIDFVRFVTTAFISNKSKSHISSEDYNLKLNECGWLVAEDKKMGITYYIPDSRISEMSSKKEEEYIPIPKRLHELEDMDWEDVNPPYIKNLDENGINESASHEHGETISRTEPKKRGRGRPPKSKI